MNQSIEKFSENLIKEFEDMSKRETLLIGPNVKQEDLLMQIIGTIIKVKNKNV